AMGRELWHRPPRGPDPGHSPRRIHPALLPRPRRRGRLGQRPRPEERGMITAAVFDVDRTLVPVTTTERIFIRYLLRRRVIGLKAVLYTVAFMARRLPQASPFELIRRQRAYLAGLPYEKIRRLALDCFETDIKPRISR